MSRELQKLRRRSQERISNLSTTIQLNTKTLDNHLGQIQDEYRRVETLSQRAPAVIENLDQEFKEKTKLEDHDIIFLFVCVALQCARQYLLSNEKLRITAAQGDDLIASATGKIMPPQWQDVLMQSVPYDAVQTGAHIRESTGLSGTTHRYRTLGHDPLLGWIFGTANIMTNSLTKYNFETYQVNNMTIVRHYPLGVGGMLKRAAEYAQKDPILLSSAVARQAIHFGSDYFTKQGLPIPVIATVNNDIAKSMITKGHIDVWSVTRGAALAALINSLIATIHRLFYDESRDGSVTLYEIRTRKILSYSNALSTGSNVVVTAFTKDLSKLDVGGIIVTLHRFLSDYNFIQSIKKDFLKNEIYKIVVGKPYDFMEV